MSIQNIRRSVIATVAVGVLAVTGLFAGRVVAHQLDGATPESRAPRMFRMLARKLDLSADQRSQIRAILKSHATEIEAQVQAGIAARRALHDAAGAETVDEAAVRSAAAQVGEAHAAGALLYSRIRAEVWPLLSAEQRDKLQSLKAERRTRGDRMMSNLDAWLRSDS